MANCSILRIVPTDSGDCNAAVLRSAIARRFRAPSHTDDDGNILRISNRYFDADVLLLGPDESADGAAADGVGMCRNQEDGAILVFDAASSSSFDSLVLHHSSAERSGRCGELLRLCVGAALGPSPLSDGSKRSEDEYSRRVLWCLDRGYEYLEADLTPEGLARGHDERDKDGFARVVEAIGTCMWSSHVMKKRRGAGGGKPVVQDVRKDCLSIVSAKNAPSQSNHLGDKSKKELATAPPASDDAEREKAAMASLMEGVKEDRPETDQASREEIAENQQDEMAFHQLEAVLSEAKLIREASRNNSMPDEERRERAGDTAMKLMGLLDSLGLADEDDTEEGSVSDGEQ